GEHSILAGGHASCHHSDWRRGSVFHHGSDHIAIFTVATAGVVGVNGIDISSCLARDSLQNSLPEELPPLQRNNAVAVCLLRIRGLRFNPDNEKPWQVRASNGVLLLVVRGWGLVPGRNPVVGRWLLVVR